MHFVTQHLGGQEGEAAAQASDSRVVYVVVFVLKQVKEFLDDTPARSTRLPARFVLHCSVRLWRLPPFGTCRLGMARIEPETVGNVRQVRVQFLTHGQSHRWLQILAEAQSSIQKRRHSAPPHPTTAGLTGSSQRRRSAQDRSQEAGAYGTGAIVLFAFTK